MLHKTRGVVLNHIKFKETSIIAKIFTEEFGLQSYIVNSVRSSRGYSKIAFYQPLMLLDLVVYKNEQKSIQRISECKFEFAYQSLLADMKKSAIVMFWAELLNRTIVSEGFEDRDKFNFIRDQLLSLEKAREGLENYPIVFAVGLCRYLGFEIEESGMVMEDAGFTSPEMSNDLMHFFDSIIKSRAIPPTNHQLRRKALSCLLNYYSVHMEDFKRIKSADILRQVLS